MTATHDTLLLRADQLLSAGHAAEAEQLAREVLGSAPGSVAAMGRLARALQRQGRHKEAVSFAREGLAFEPDDLSLGLALINSLLHVRRVPEARELAQELAAAHPHAWTATYTLARVLLAQGDVTTRRALRTAQEAQRLAPYEPDPINLVGLCHQRLCQFDAARHAFLEALRLDPTNGLAQTNLAALDIQSLRVRKGARAATRAITTNPNSPETHRAFAHQVTRIGLYFFLLALVGLFAVFLLMWKPWWVHATVSILFVLAGVLLVIPVLRWLPPGARHWVPRIWQWSSGMTRCTIVVGLLLVVAQLGLGLSPTVSTHGASASTSDSSEGANPASLLGALVPIVLVAGVWLRIANARFGWLPPPDEDESS